MKLYPEKMPPAMLLFNGFFFRKTCERYAWKTECGQSGDPRA